MTRSKILIPASIAAVVILLAGAAYLFNLPPFSAKRGEIKAGSVCDSLGSASQTVKALQKILPDEPSYSFDDDVNIRVDDSDDSYRSDCFVAGGNSQLLSARTEMMRAEPAKEWVSSEVREKEPEAQSLTPFAAEYEGVASSNVAAAFVPCATEGHVPGGPYNLSIIIELKQHREASERKLREGLIELAKNAAAFAHQKARCDQPSKIAQ
ncbi:hypothetical protein [Streptomyces avermitilis]|uniref:hypothetical protein n=1 Tax=Streptomyces avermitilis TaxID=33903 RepID=UPI0036CD2246